MKAIIEVEPMGAVRMTQKGKYKDPAAQRYLSYKEIIAWKLATVCKTPTKQPVSVTILFVMPIPESWSKKKQKESIGAYHTKKPDIDNLIKGAFDAANEIIWQDDNQVVKCNVMKIYGERPCIEIEVEPLYEDVIA